MHTFFSCITAIFVLACVTDSMAQKTISYGRCVSIRSTYSKIFNDCWGTIERYDITNNASTKFGTIYNSGNARNANISPDGNRVAFVRNDGKMCIINIDGTGSVQELGSVDEAATAWLDWPMAEWIYFSTKWSTHSLARINVNTKQVQNLGNVAVNGLWTISVSQDGTRACISADDGGWSSSLLTITNNQITGKTKEGACGGSISPNGELFTINHGGHDCIDIKKWSDKQNLTTFCTSRRSSAGPNWNRHRWSSNSNDWVCLTQGAPYQMESYHNMVLYYVPDEGVTNIQVTSNGNGAYNEADDLWIGTQTSPNPVLRISPTEIALEANQGQNPSSQTITASNIGAGNLPALSVSSNTTWCTPSVAGTTVTVAFNASALPGGVHDATVTVSGSGVDPATSLVRLTVVAPPVLTTIEVSNKTLTPGSETQLTASALDQYGSPMSPQPSITWTKESGDGAVSGSGLFTAPGADGSAVVKASSGSVSGTAVITIQEAPPVNIKVDCGANPVDGWESDAAYLVSGNEWMPDFTFTTVDVSGALNPAPAAVYLSAPLSQTRNAYSFDVPNGVYLVRLHSMLGSGHDGVFKMDFSIEGKKVLDDFDPKTAAGGFDRAVAREFTVTVNDGNGLQITGDNDGGVSVYLCGIEVIWSSPILGAAVVVTAPNGGETYRSGETMTIAWTADPQRVSAVAISLSIDGGDNWVLLNNASIPAFNQSETGGSFSWAIPEALLGTQLMSSNCLILINDYVDPDLFDESDAPFAINTEASVGIRQYGGMSRSVAILRKTSGLAVSVANVAHELAVYSLSGTLVMKRGGARAAIYPIGNRAGIPMGTYVIQVNSKDVRWRGLVNVTE